MVSNKLLLKELTDMNPPKISRISQTILIKLPMHAKDRIAKDTKLKPNQSKKLQEIEKQSLNI
jgi:hypothetical protein